MNLVASPQNSPTSSEIARQVQAMHDNALTAELSLLKLHREIGRILEEAVASGAIKNFKRFVDEELTFSRGCAYQYRKIYTEWETIEKIVGISRVGPTLALKALGRYNDLEQQQKPALSLAKAPPSYPAGTLVKVVNPMLDFDGQVFEIVAQEKLVHYVQIDPNSQRRYPLFASEIEPVDPSGLVLAQQIKRQPRRSPLQKALLKLIDDWRGDLPQPFLERLQELLS